ncbi:exodeoxyribonuclease III [Holophaga foetida]|uniref:exodeoxyribonuclease III n=1 Tax=Holophaga foetida TaxID=35839 RepID=UPI0002474CFF|nr:exodeoxyribonuclease III [Holophaga foetida]
MKFVSWNINGFRSALKNGFMDWLEDTDPDVLSLQEIRAEWDQVDLGVRQMLEANYDICWFPATRKKGYAGSATLSRKGLGWIHTPGLGIEDYDCEGRIVQSERGDLTLLAGYFPNASSGLVRLPYKRQFALDLAERVRQVLAQGRQLIVTGDMNVAPEEIDLARPKDNRMSPGFTDEEREDFRGYLASGLRDVLREQNPGTPGLYTWWSQRGGARAKNVGWRIDLFLVSEGLMGRVKDTRIHPDTLGSDHCPISLELD